MGDKKMAFEFKLPDLGEGITEGEVVKWKVAQGEQVEEHQVLLDLETDKAIVEVPSPKKGRVAKLNKKEGDVVNVGETLLEIDTAEAAAPVVHPEEAPEAPEEKEPVEEESFSIVGKVPQTQEVMAAPKARALARKLGVDLSGVKGTGPGGFITEADVQAASVGKASPGQEQMPAQAAPATPAAAPPKPEKWGPVERVPLKGIRRSIARNLMASQKSAAFVTGMDDADVTELWELRARERRVAREKGIHLTLMPFFMKAIQHALTSHPMLNASMDDERGEIVVKKYYNIGVAVMTPDGLMVSVVRDVDKKTILELATELQGLSKKARERKITLEELKGSTFTISNYGSFGGTYATPIINSPDVAILGTGRVADRPWVKGGSILIRKVLPLSLTFDHRVIDGAEAAQFLNKVKGYLEDPGRIFIESA
ncbi:MAG: dihydrolipoamide acetyltransferase family protein [Thermodesulfobacteriota bacterium]